MVHALERARRQLTPGGALVCIQPHVKKRYSIAITGPGSRQPVTDLINPVFQPLITAAVAAIRIVVAEGQLALIGTSSHRYRVRLAGPAALHRYLHLTATPPRFPPGGRKRLQALWRTRTEGALIEVTEFFEVMAMRAL
jgi:hypothetical protein